MSHAGAEGQCVVGGNGAIGMGGGVPMIWSLSYDQTETRLYKCTKTNLRPGNGSIARSRETNFMKLRVIQSIFPSSSSTSVPSSSHDRPSHRTFA